MANKPLTRGQKATRTRRRRQAARKPAATMRHHVAVVNRSTEVAYALVNILHERGGIVRIMQNDWTIYDELANRLQLSPDERTRKTRSGTSAFEATVGLVQAALRNERIVSEVPGEPGTWTLQDWPERGLVWLMTTGQGAD